MPFATDRDLLVLEPSLFRDVSWTAQKLIDVPGGGGGASISGTTLTASAADFVGAGVAAGHVALVAGVAHEVVERLSATTLTVSRLRADPVGAPIAPPGVTGAALVIATFGPQIRLIHDQVMRALGIEPTGALSGGGGGGASQEGAVTEASIVNGGALAEVEALGALHLILSGAAALVGEDSTMWAKAMEYRERFQEARRRAAAMLDTDGDGVGDAARRISAGWLRR